MTRPHPTRRRVGAALAGFAMVAAGCSGDAEPTGPETEPPAAYQQPPEDLCEQLQVEEVLQRWELSVPGRHEPSTDYRTERVWWYVRCSFAGRADGGRFATELEEFQPSGGVTLRIYHEAADAASRYEQTDRGYSQRAEEHEEGAGEFEASATTTDMAGWWDAGVSLELAGELDPAGYTVGDFEITSLAMERLVRHENLVAQAYVEALSPTGQVQEASALLRELLPTLLDEAVDHLPRTTR